MVRFTVAAACLVSIAAHAEIPENAQPIRLGDADAFVHLRTGYQYSDNKFLVPDDPVDSAGIIVQPTATLRSSRRTLALEGLYEGRYGSFDDQTVNYDDHLFRLGVSAGLTKRLGALAELSYVQDHDEFGVELATGADDRRNELLVSETVLFRVGGTYGSSGARGNLRLGLTTSSLRRDSGVSVGTVERSLVEPFAAFSLRLSQDTRGTVEVRHGVYDYDQGGTDRSITSVLTGIDFAATGKLRGSFRVGLSSVEFDSGNDDREEDSTVVLESRLNYRASAISRWEIVLDRVLDNQRGSTTDFSSANVVENDARLIWRYAWSGRFYHRASIGFRAIERPCPGLDTQTVSGGLELGMNVYRWLSVSFGVGADRRSGDDCPTSDVDGSALDYDRSTLGVSVSATL